MSEDFFKTESDEAVRIVKRFDPGRLALFHDFQTDVSDMIESHANNVGRPCEIRVTVEVNDLE